jgi:hypothetical protein
MSAHCLLHSLEGTQVQDEKQLMNARYLRTIGGSDINDILIGAHTLHPRSLQSSPSDSTRSKLSHIHTHALRSDFFDVFEQMHSLACSKTPQSQD